MDINLFLGLYSNTIIIYFLVQIVQTLAIGSSFRMAPMPLQHASSFSYFEFFGALLYFLAPKHAPGSSSIFLAKALKSTNSSRSLSSFYWRMVFRNQDLGA